jgi:hypothetical protein
MRTLKIGVLMGAAVLATAATPLLADWLVMKDGAKLETKGPLEVRGAQVVFYRTNGTLSSVRASDVDLDASKQATETALHPPPKPAPTPAPEKKPAIVVTDRDVAHVETAAPMPAVAAADGAKAAPAPAPGPTERVRVANWHQDLGNDISKGVTIVADVSNVSQELVGEIHVTARLFDEKGKEVASSEAMLGTSTLKPGATTNLRATFPGVFAFSEVRFEPHSLALRMMAPMKP